MCRSRSREQSISHGNNLIWLAGIFFFFLVWIGRLSGLKRTHTAPSLIWWRMSEWECTPCCMDPAPTAPWSKAQTTLNWSRNLPAQVSFRRNIKNKIFGFYAQFDIHGVCLSKRRRRRYGSPGFRLRVLLQELLGVHLGKKCKDVGQLTA